MRVITLLGLLWLAAAISDIARPYPSGKEPGFIVGTAAAHNAGAGEPQPNGKELAHLGNQHLGHNYGDLAR